MDRGRIGRGGEGQRRDKEGWRWTEGGTGRGGEGQREG